MPILPLHTVLQDEVIWGRGAFLLGKEKTRDAGHEYKEQNCFFYWKKKKKGQREEKNIAGIFSRPTQPVFLQFLHLVQTLPNSQSNSSRGWNITNNPLGELQG